MVRIEQSVVIDRSIEEVFAFFEQNVDKVRGLLYKAIEAVPVERGCACADGPNGMDPPPPLA